MKWEQISKYCLKSKQDIITYYISKSNIYEKVIYELWIGNKWLYKSENIDDVKNEALQYHQEQSTSPSAEAK